MVSCVTACNANADSLSSALSSSSRYTIVNCNHGPTPSPSTIYICYGEPSGVERRPGGAVGCQRDISRSVGAEPSEGSGGGTNQYSISKPRRTERDVERDTDGTPSVRRLMQMRSAGHGG